MKVLYSTFNQKGILVPIPSNTKSSIRYYINNTRPLNPPYTRIHSFNKTLFILTLKLKRHPIHQTHISKPPGLFIVSPDESRGYLGFSTVTPPPHGFPFRRDNLKNIFLRAFKFGMWVDMGKTWKPIVLWPQLGGHSWSLKGQIWVIFACLGPVPPYKWTYHPYSYCI